MKRKAVHAGLLVLLLVALCAWRALPGVKSARPKADDFPLGSESKPDPLPADLPPWRREEWEQALVLIQAAEELGKYDNDEEARTGQKISAKLYRQAVELLEAIVHDVPDFAPACWALGVAQENLGSFAEAEKENLIAPSSRASGMGPSQTSGRPMRLNGSSFASGGGRPRRGGRPARGYRSSMLSG